VERLWRTVKYEYIYLKRYETVGELKAGLTAYFRHYNEQRIHQALAYQTPAQVYHSGIEKPSKVSGLRLQLSNSFSTQTVTTTRE
jgi:transposase InsO family protein